MFALDVSHTAHTDAQSGIQQVVRSLWRELGPTQKLLPVVFDPYLSAWRGLDAGEQATLASHSATPGGKRGARWRPGQKHLGRARRIFGLSPRKLPVPRGTPLLAAEIWGKHGPASHSQWRERGGGPIKALFYDAITVRHPEWAPAKTRAMFPAYLQQMAQLDGISAISEASAQELSDLAPSLRLSPLPPVKAIPLGVRTDLTSGHDPAQQKLPARATRFASIGTLEARKNHEALLTAAEMLWTEGHDFSLQLLGRLNRETGATAAQMVGDLQKKGRDITWEEAADQARIAETYATADATLYVSRDEGYGLPVAESLALGCPVIATAAGALAELVHAGGCQVVGPEADDIASVWRRLLTEPEHYQQLCQAAQARPTRTLAHYAAEIAAWMREPIG